MSIYMKKRKRICCLQRGKKVGDKSIGKLFKVGIGIWAELEKR